MPEYIAKEALLDKAQLAYRIALSEDDINSGKYSDVEFTDNFAVDQDDIVDLPAVAVAEVVHGEWTQDGSFDEDDNVYTCSVCGEPWTLDAGTPADNNMHYCPNCGAKMEKSDV